MATSYERVGNCGHRPGVGRRPRARVKFFAHSRAAAQRPIAVTGQPELTGRSWPSAVSQPCRRPGTVGCATHWRHTTRCRHWCFAGLGPQSSGQRTPAVAMSYRYCPWNSRVSRIVRGQSGNRDATEAKVKTLLYCPRRRRAPQARPPGRTSQAHRAGGPPSGWSLGASAAIRSSSATLVLSKSHPDFPRRPHLREGPPPAPRPRPPAGSRSAHARSRPDRGSPSRR